MLEKWLDKKIRALGYIKSEDAIAPDVVEEKVNASEQRLEKRAAELNAVWEKALEENRAELKTATASLKRSITASTKKTEALAENEFNHKTKELEKHLDITKQELAPELIELRKKNVELERRLKEIEEVRKEGKASKGEVMKRLKDQDNRIDQLVYEQETSLATIREFTQRYNSVIKPQSRFI